MKIEMFGLRLPLIKQGDDVVRLIIEEAQREIGGIQERDIVIITSKILSKALGFLIELDKLKPSTKALRIAKVTGSDPKLIQAVLDNSDAVLFIMPVYKLAKRATSLEKVSKNQEKAWEALRRTSCELITVREGLLSGNAGLDTSNHPEGIASVPPTNLDEIARKFRSQIAALTGHEVAVIITDTEWLSPMGTLDCAKGSSGIQINARKLGNPDLYGKPKYGGWDSIVDEIAAASALLVGQTSEGIPVVIMRGFKYDRSDEGVSDYYQFDARRARRAIKEIIKDSVRALGLRWVIRLF